MKYDALDHFNNKMQLLWSYIVSYVYVVSIVLIACLVFLILMYLKGTAITFIFVFTTLIAFFGAILLVLFRSISDLNHTIGYSVDVSKEQLVIYDEGKTFLLKPDDFQIRKVGKKTYKISIPLIARDKFPREFYLLHFTKNVPGEWEMVLNQLKRK